MRTLLLSACILSAACAGDATGPDACDAPKACHVGGPDVAIVQVYAEAEDTWAGRIARADGFDVVVEVLNRGDRRALGGRLEVEAWTATGSTALPSLGVGERLQLRIPLAYTRAYLVHGRDPAAIAPVARIRHEGDARAANDTLRGDEFITDLPVFDLAAIPWGAQSARVGGTVRLGVLISRRLAPTTPDVTVDALYCVLDGNRGCTPSTWQPMRTWQSIGMYSFANSQEVRLDPIHLPPVPGSYRLAVCIMPSRDDLSVPLDVENPEHVCVDSGVLQLLP